MLWLVLLPFRLLFTLIFGLLALPLIVLLLPIALLLWIPFLVLKFAFRLATGLILLPLVAAAAVLGVILAGVAAVALMLPIVPIILMLGLAWLLLRRPVPVSPI
jgi:hypothetical protein